MNSGSAVSVHDELADQIVVAIASPAGREVNSSMPASATPISDRPTHTPLPSSANRTPRKTPVSSSSSTFASSVAGVGGAAL